MSRTPVTKPYSMKSAGWYLQSCQPFRKGGIWYDCKLHRADGTEVKLFVRSRCTNKKSNTRATRQFRSSLQFHFGARGTYLFHRVVAFNCCNPRIYRSGRITMSTISAARRPGRTAGWRTWSCCTLRSTRCSCTRAPLRCGIRSIDHAGKCTKCVLACVLANGSRTEGSEQR